MKLFKALGRLRNRLTGRTNDPVDEAALLAGFEALLRGKMEKVRPGVVAALRTLCATPGDAGYHVEVFLDEPGFSLRLFDKGRQDAWSPEPEAVEAANAAIEALWPLVTQAELDAHTVWEIDPKWGRQVALEQPLDRLDLKAIVLPWLKGIVAEARGAQGPEFTAALHDITGSEAL